ncbi:uncharacterized protein LOC132899921 isoform X2 [Neoarius graeffei]|uniref:uncharacterized protein LOC132899921 isoform X2 n=1 Tax=Neoarius graeffei TaxID=443677 RepID=UPI00298D2DC8|nr:uncharacterized protein LOC132899921 isoform X2 [Neoarius graeffei]
MCKPNYAQHLRMARQNGALINSSLYYVSKGDDPPPRIPTHCMDCPPSCSEETIEGGHNNMASPKRAKHGNCAVHGCDNTEKSLFLLLTGETLKTQWLNFIYFNNMPSSLPKTVYVCRKHFPEECFHNLGQYRAGFAHQLSLKPGSVPRIPAASATNTEQAKDHILFILQTLKSVMRIYRRKYKKMDCNQHKLQIFLLDVDRQILELEQCLQVKCIRECSWRWKFTSEV